MPTQGPFFGKPLQHRLLGATPRRRFSLRSTDTTMTCVVYLRLFSFKKGFPLQCEEGILKKIHFLTDFIKPEDLRDRASAGTAILHKRHFVKTGYVAISSNSPNNLEVASLNCCICASHCSVALARDTRCFATSSINSLFESSFFLLSTYHSGT